MEFPFDVNYVLPYEVTIFDGDYRILNHGQTTRGFASEKLSSIIDAIGDASYKAQGLYGAVTTARKFRISDHRLYIIKKANENNALGLVVGILKVGPKHLYIYDSNGQVHERTPLCVLDFYVHESQQRLGFGKRLFDTMLEFEKCAPYELAIDRPSNKCLAFLHKHYNLSAPIHQVNNFVVYQLFFNRSPITINRQPSPVKQQQELPSWLLQSEKEQRRPVSQQNEFGRNQRIRTVPNEADILGNRRQGKITAKDERPPVSYYATSYGQNYNTNGIPDSAPYMLRTYSQAFNENNPFPSLQRSNTNSIVPPNHQSSLMNNYRRTVETAPVVTKPEPLTSIYTFPSLIKPSNNWRQQQTTIDSTSSGWRLFGVHRLLN